MNRLEEFIRDRILREGPITFRDFMELALYHPELGYYSRGPAIGREGDFFTSSSVGDLFGRALALALKEMLEVSGGDTLVEMGAGTGDLAADVLSEFRRRGWGVRYVIVEKSPALVELQKKRLSGFGVEWASSVSELSGVRGVFFSNELVDAFPVHVVEKRDGRLWEVCVDWRDGFCEVLAPPSSPLIEEFFSMQGVELAEGFRTEVNLEMLEWLSQVASAIDVGFLLTIDYGYTSAEFYADYRSRGTLMCYWRHTPVEDPYIRVGEQDMTSHVNFSVLAAYGERFGLEVVGFTNQANFLIDAGILELAKEPSEMLKVKTLIMPGQGMGETFKVLVQQKGIKGKINLRCLSHAPKRPSFSL